MDINQLMLDVRFTYYLIGRVQEMFPTQTFFRDRYFPSDTSMDVFNTDKVLVEYRDVDRGMAPFIVPRKGDMPIGRLGYSMAELEPPYIAPSRTLTIDDLTKRGFGEAVMSQETPEERQKRLLDLDLRELDSCITRREEWMAVQTLMNNGFSAIALVDDTDLTKGEPFDVYYYDPAGSNPALYTVGATWDSDPMAFWQDVELMCQQLAMRAGASPTSLSVRR